ncbi:helix-turn-helix domain-containing protein [Saccharothrix sp. ALI-22-I]|uniref:helix-turn-helix domain-containing protein n=1 Tax=Saccharothrix sp. ALI-22-I TaxID=1933778 RepID=UPI001EE6AD19|nr:helix-turn-helix domain-containing protein [Saccharothrix sp. ALI-22-I]
MARHPSVFVRPLSMEEGRRLQRVTRTAKDPVRLRRAIAVLMSRQGLAVRDVTSLMQVGEDYVRDVVHGFNERGFAALDPKWSGGRSRTIGEAVRQRICPIARTSPADWGITAFSTPTPRCPGVGQPETNFATDSPIRTWTRYPAKAA